VTPSPDDRAEGQAVNPAQQGQDTVVPDVQFDAKVLALRDQGRSFARIAREMDLAQGLQANVAFNRALRRLPAADQEVARRREMGRLDALGERLRQRDDLDESEVARRMRSLDRLRKALGA